MEKSYSAFDRWMYKKHFTYKETKGKNISVQCNLCLPKIKYLSTAKYFTSNLKKHLERIHAVHQKTTTSCGPSSSRDQTEGPSSPKKTKLENSIYQATSRSTLNALVFNFIVEDVQPFSILEQPAFRKLIEVLSRGKKVMSQKTFVVRLEAVYDKMKEELKAKLDTVQLLCTTADIWSAHNRSYFGMTCHWLEENLERKSAALACTRISGNHTIETVVGKIQEIHASYNIESKVRAVVTDNGSHFVKVFKDFSTEDDGDLDESQFEDLSSILCEGEVGGDVFLSYFLPPHQRCAAHTLNLIASEDLVDAIIRGPTCRLHYSSVSKCAAIWNKAHHSAVPVDTVEFIANMKLLVPCVTRWYSEYFVVQKIVSLTDSQRTELADLLYVPHFTAEEIAYLKEYADVLKPVALALDLLQGEKKCFLGIVIPTLLTLKAKLQEKVANTRFFSEVIDNTVKVIDSRFKRVFDSIEAKLATTTIPQFRLWWLPESERKPLRDKLVAEVLQFDQGNEESHTSGDSLHDDEFFSYGPGSFDIKDRSSGAFEEVQKYLEGTNKELKCLNEFPGVKKVFLKFNTTLSSSATVERLFSHRGYTLTPKRSNLTDEHFEQVLLLRYNSKICSLVFE